MENAILGMERKRQLKRYLIQEALSTVIKAQEAIQMDFKPSYVEAKLEVAIGFLRELHDAQEAAAPDEDSIPIYGSRVKD